MIRIKNCMQQQKEETERLQNELFSFDTFYNQNINFTKSLFNTKFISHFLLKSDFDQVKYHNNTQQINTCRCEEESQNTNSQKTSGRQSKATCFLFTIKMIAKLERTLKPQVF